MRRLNLIDLVLCLWCARLCTSQNAIPYGVPIVTVGQSAPPAGQPMPPVGQILDVGSLSADNPTHKPILNWIDNYRQKSAELTASLQGTDQSKQDLVSPNFSSINAALRQTSSQPQASPAANPGLPGYYEDLLKSTTSQSEKPILLDTSSLGQVLTPYAFSQGQNGQGVSQGDRIVVDHEMAMRLFDQNRKRIEKLDPVVQDHIRKLQEQSLNDGRAVFVDVKGDNLHDDSSLLEKLRPMLYDPSVLDELKPQLRESKSVMNNKDNLVLKRPVLQYDKPLLEQRDKIEELRHALEERRISPRPILTPEEEQRKREQFNAQFLAQNVKNQQPFQLLPQNSVTPLITDKNQLIKQLEALALQPLLGQNPGPQQIPPKQAVPQLVKDVRQPLILGASGQSGHGNDQAILLGQRPRQQPQFSEQPLTFNWQTGGHVQPESGPDNHHLATDQVVKRQEGDEWNGQPQENKWDYNEPDPQRQRMLREDLAKHLEEQERKRQELMELDLKQRQMIAEERHKQEERDRQEAERRAMIKDMKDRQSKQQGNNRDKQQWQQPEPNWPSPPPPPPPPQNRQESPWQKQEQARPIQEQPWQPKQEQPWPKQEQTWSKPEQPRQRQEQPWPEQPRPKQEQPWQPKQEQPWPKQEQARPRQEQPRSGQEPPWPKQEQINWQPATSLPSPLPIPAPFTSAPPQQKPRQIVSEQRWNSQEEPITIRNKIVDKDQLNSGLIDSLQSYPGQPSLQTPPKFPQPLKPTSIGNWPSNEAIAQIENNQKQLAGVNGPIMISAAALAQAEQSDAEYVKLLREILLNQGKGTQFRPETRFVALDQAIGGGRRAQADNGESDWWKSGDSRPRMASFGNNRPMKEGSNT